MRTKLQAASIATAQGIDAVTANGKSPQALYDIVKGVNTGALFVGKRVK